MLSVSTTRAGALIRMNTTLFVREPGPLLSRIVMPVIIITLMRPLYAAAFGTTSGTAQAVAGMLVMFSLLGMSIVGTSIMVERFWHTAERLRATPAAGFDILLGKVTPVLALMLVQQIVILGYGRLAFGMQIQAPLTLAITVLIWSITLVCFGAMLGALARSGSALAAMVDIGSLSVTGLGGAFVPLKLLPFWAQPIAPLSPGYWAMRAFRGALEGDWRMAAIAWLVLAAFAASAVLIAGRRVRKGWGRTSPG